MNESRPSLTRYLLGELSEAEQTALEEEYFRDPHVFDEVARAESELVDAYVRGTLSPPTRRRFEQVYLADPRRHQRVRFAEALASTIDRAEGAPETGWRTWLHALRRPGPALGWAVASLLVVSMAAGGIWFVIEGRRSRQAQTAAGGAGAQPGTAERFPPADQSAPRPAPTPDERPAPAFVTLALAVGPGMRGADTSPAATLAISRGMTEVRLRLTLREHDYPSYVVVLRRVGGTEILRRSNLRPTVGGSGAGFNLSLPSSRFETGDYMLTLQGANSAGELDDLSQSLFRVEKK